MGISPFVTAMIVVFGLYNPRAIIYLLIIPVQAAWIAWGSGLFALLSFLANRTLDSSLWLGGWIAGYAFIESQPGGVIRRFFIRQKHKRTHDRLNKFKVYKGGKDDTIH